MACIEWFCEKSRKLLVSEWSAERKSEIGMTLMFKERIKRLINGENIWHDCNSMNSKHKTSKNY